VINGFIPTQPPPRPTENDPEPFLFSATDEMLAYVPAGHAAAKAGVTKGEWRSLDDSSRFPHNDYHHMMGVAHKGEIWAIGGHNGIRFYPADTIYIFKAKGATDPNGSWAGVREDGSPCDGKTEKCLSLPEPRAAGAAVSIGDRIVVLGGVVF